MTATLRTADGALFDPSAYEVHLRPLTEDEGGGWFATIPDLPGCMGDGESEAEAIMDVRSAACEWADAAVADGEQIPAPSYRTAEAAE
ncbi:type II toxin-antitoxin system HicB family antitoxin [Jiella sonneratiae]|uniref:Type II toxin-antitoxin system HicB family antitoxin n=1 Tax=Jiella sonneratiae TaxID=2816856 RepID=A0ABS3J6M6_9HYPH|nr:type II toxin-antitoxin system HicB family antitoxin [Jiella sonneratiae]MBO0905323.1 type II toxin-antitoxin system HicB family antitoxin [Jiella sonneratiae]